MKQLLTTALVLFVTAACVGPMAPIRDAKDDQVGQVYGYINGNLGVPNVTLYNKEARIPGEIKYLGAYHYAHEPGLFSNEFTLARIDDPSPAAVLEWAIEATGKTSWTGRLRTRLRELNGAN